MGFFLFLEDREYILYIYKKANFMILVAVTFSDFHKFYIFFIFHKYVEKTKILFLYYKNLKIKYLYSIFK